MKVIVLGAGVVGVTSAHYLAEAGHEVVVIDRQPGPSLETSFANAGEVSPGYASPWAGPGIPMKALRWLFMHHAPLILRPKPDPDMLRWLLAMLRNCTAGRYALNKSRMVGIAEYSRDALIELRTRLDLDYDQRSQGTLQLFRTQKQYDASAGDIEVLKSYGVPYELLDRDGCVRAEPGLAASRDLFVGGLRLPNDETGDCAKFTIALADRLAAQGSTSATTRRSRRSKPIPAGSGRSGPIAARSPATPIWSRSPASRHCCCGRSASACRSIR